MEPRVLAFVAAEDWSKDAIHMALRRAGARVERCSDVGQAMGITAEEDAPMVVVADAAAAGAMELVRGIREAPSLYGVPIILVVPDAQSTTFEESHNMGADDVVVSGCWNTLTAKVRKVLESEPSPRIDEVHGTILIAHPSAERRRALARGLRRAGFGVAFAGELTDVAAQVAHAEPRAILVSDTLLGEDVLEGVASLHEESGAAVIVLAPARHVRALHLSLAALKGVRVSSDHASAVELIFGLGELFRPDAAEVRASARLLFGSACTFRTAGRSDPSHGLSYNISLEGMYVQTLDSPAPGTKLWIELSPPGSRELIQLRGEVAWRRGPRPSTAGGPAPAGFGLRITEAACAKPDLESFQTGYRNLLAAHRGGRQCAPMAQVGNEAEISAVA